MKKARNKPKEHKPAETAEQKGPKQKAAKHRAVEHKVEKHRLTERELRVLMRELENDENILRMKQYVQHGKISTYDHCRSVARVSLKMAEILPLPVHKEELVRGAFLHDYFLYDWHHYDKPWHGLTHPKAAGENAERDFRLTGREKNIIESHMWPLTPLAFPASLEAVLVNVADKICSAKETIFDR